MTKVEKSTNEAMEWMNNKLNLQKKQSLTVEPVVKGRDTEAKIKVIYSTKYVIFFSYRPSYLLLIVLKMAFRRGLHDCTLASGLRIG